jgi:hypothetical protein
MSESTEHSSIDAIEPSNASMKLMAVMLAAVAVSVAAVLGLIRGSEALMLAVALPAATVCLVVVLWFILKLTGEGDEPDPELTNLG